MVDMAESRKNTGAGCRLKAVIRKELPDHRTELMEFLPLDLSPGGFFIATEDLSLFDLGEEVHVLIDEADGRCFEGKARVARSVRVFIADGEMKESGFGLVFEDKDSQ